jgi:hypothetical protein
MNRIRRGDGPWLTHLHRRTLMRAAMLLFAFLRAHPAAAQSEPHELLFFLSATSDSRSGLEKPYLERNEFTPRADVLYSRSRDRFRMLGEYLVTDEEHELERFQVGWQLSEATRIWLGRFHHSRSYWNTEHHHGQFLQTSITRPALEAFEDDGGVLPAHTTGVLLESRQELANEAGLSFSFSAGLSGRLGRDEIKPLDLLDPEAGHKPGFDLRVSFFPEFLGDDQVGFLFGKHLMAIDAERVLPASWDPLSNEINLTTTGFYGDWNFDRWHLIGSVTRVETSARGGSDTRSYHFTAGYAQAEFMLREQLIVYGRAENTARYTNYLDLFPAYVTRQILFGTKWYPTRRQALSLELADAETMGDRFSRISVQWSAVFP